MADPAKKVLIAHVPYQHRGGEDAHVELLAEAYRAIGVTPVLYPSAREPASGGMLVAGVRSLWSAEPPADFLELWEREKPGFIHAHNLFPQLGPAFLRWVIRSDVRLVMTIHNHRFYCTNGLALRGGRVCKDCFGARVAWRPVAYNCNGSRAKSAYHAAALTEIRGADLYRRAVSAFIAPSPYIAAELVRWGAAPESVVQVVNPAKKDPAPTPAPRSSSSRPRVFFAGRLAEEKGIRHLLEAAPELKDCEILIAGDGPLRSAVERMAQAQGHVRYLGQRSREEILKQVGESDVGVLPSICNEILPTFVLECYSAGVPCAISDTDSTRWLAQGSFEGLGALFSTGNSKALVSGVRKGLALPKPSSERLEQVRMELGFERFCQELQSRVVHGISEGR